MLNIQVDRSTVRHRSTYADFFVHNGLANDHLHSVSESISQTDKTDTYEATILYTKLSKLLLFLTD